MLTTVDARNVRVFPFLGFQNLAVQEPDPCISKHVAAHVPFHGENPKASNNLNCTAFTKVSRRRDHQLGQIPQKSQVLGSSRGGQQAMTCDLTFIYF